ncbi:MAG: hypothetical protein HY892_09170 [Deltaproteobacteria bacterium]|nr:hypothetical protein [Deltaproteobacteria bacterium]
MAPYGQDTASCGEISQPCRSLQYAANKAETGDTLLVAAGTYTFNQVADVCSPVVGDTAVLCFYNKGLSIIGGFSADNWVTSNPADNPTIIDGQGYRRGVLLKRADASLKGLIIKNGLTRGASNGTGYSTYAFGGGILADYGTLSLNNIRLINNQVIGGNTNAEAYGGAGSGGGLAVRLASRVDLEQVTFEGNSSTGGWGNLRGGYGMGGGLFTYQTTVFGKNLDFFNNSSRAGSTGGSGIDQIGERSDACGGGASFQEGSQVVLEKITASGNQSFGGNAAQYAGGAFGGAFSLEEAQVTIKEADIRDNLAQGGNAVNGWLGNGGGIEAINSTLNIERSLLIKNTARGGNGTTGDMGAAGGGGLNVTWFGSSLSSNLSISNTIVADNEVVQGQGAKVTGGGGGGLWIQGTRAALDHLTISGNTISDNMQGQGVLLIAVGNVPASATMAHSLVTNHGANSSAAALHVKTNNTVTLIDGRWSGNLKDHNAGDSNAGTFIGLGTMTTVDNPGYVAPGAPLYDYHLRYASPVRDQAKSSSMTVDLDNDNRALPDMGADEYVPFPLRVSSGDGTLYLNWGNPAAGIFSPDYYYELTVQCPTGAETPKEIRCGQSLNIGSLTSFLLTGLTNYQGYTLWVAVKEPAGAILDLSRTVTAFATDIHVYLPLVVKQQ